MGKPPPGDNVAELVFAPAKPGNEAWLIALDGPSGSGKTLSALRLARGIAGPNGTIGFADTENRRALFYARDHVFDHCPIYEPFEPSKYVTAVERSRAAGHSVLVIDSMSHEWAGLGGLLDMHETELMRMAGEDYAKREKMTTAAWIRPKAAHNAMMARLLQLNVHVIFCLRAQKKIAMERNEKNKIVPVDVGFQPICSKEFMFDMTLALSLMDDKPGVPMARKTINERHRHLIDMNAVLDEATGARIAAYARGETITHGEKQRVSPSPPPESSTVPETKAAGAGRRKVGDVVADLISQFDRTKTRADHFRIVDNAAVRGQMDWIKKNSKPEIFETGNKALRDSFKRTAGSGEPPGEQAA